jgi:hypothetical protein
MTKYINGLFNYIRKEMILFDVKPLEEACKKAMYIEGKHGRKSIDGTCSSRVEGRNTQEGKGKLKEKNKFSNTTQKDLHCEQC